MEGEHFGIAPVEGLASGRVTIVHNSGGKKNSASKNTVGTTTMNSNRKSSTIWVCRLAENLRKELWAESQY